MTIPLTTPVISSFDQLVRAYREGRIHIFTNQNSLYYSLLKVSLPFFIELIFDIFVVIKSEGIESSEMFGKASNLDFLYEIANIMKTSKIDMAYVSTEQSLFNAIRKDPTAYYLAKGQNNRFILDNIAIALRKGFQYKREFNKRFDFLKKKNF